MRILFCNIGWMERYNGRSPTDEIIGGGAYVKEEGRGHEMCNFSPVGNILYGYVQPHGNQIKIERLGASKEDQSVKGVTVIWTAKRPNGSTVIVGWYRDAIVYRTYQEFKTTPQRQSENGIDGYWIEAPLSKSKLLPIDARIFEVPRKTKGGMGQSNVWFAGEPESRPFLKKFEAFLKGEKISRPTLGKKGGISDPERKAMVETAAIRCCSFYFESLGYAIVSVEKDNVGWDLEARSGKIMLRIEVKGLAGKDFAVELTPNEYKAFNEKATDYRLAVVLNALERVPGLLICHYSNEQKDWVIQGREASALKIKIRESASLSCS